MNYDSPQCPSCHAENLTDYGVCPTCAATCHFEHRECCCDECAAITPIEYGYTLNMSALMEVA